MSNVVGMSSGIGIGNWETSSNLSNGVGFSVSLAIVESRSSISIVSSVANGSITRDKTMAIVYTSDEATSSVAMGHLSNSVGITAYTGDEDKNLVKMSMKIYNHNLSKK